MSTEENRKPEERVQPPRVLELLLSMALPAEYRDALLGDLREEYAAKLVPALGRSGAILRYCREIVLAARHFAARRIRSLVKGVDDAPIAGDEMKETEMVEDAKARSVAQALTLGALGGVALVATVSSSTRGQLVLITYAALVIASVLYLRFARMQSIRRRFGIAFGSFVLASVILYVFIGVVQTDALRTISAAGHAWRLGLMALIGGCVSSAVAWATETTPVAE